MNTDNIKSIEDFAQARREIKNDIELANKKLDMDIAKIRYQMMPTTLLQNVMQRISDRIMMWVDSKL